MRLLRRVPPVAWFIGFGALFVIMMLAYLGYFVYQASQPAIVATAPYTTYPRAVCPGDLIIIEYRAVKLRAGNQNLVSVSNWYNPQSHTRYAAVPSIYGAIFPDGTNVIRSLTEARVPESLPSGTNEYWRAIAGQPGSLIRMTLEVLPRESCPPTELEDQETEVR